MPGQSDSLGFLYITKLYHRIPAHVYIFKLALFVFLFLLRVLRSRLGLGRLNAAPVHLVTSQAASEAVARLFLHPEISQAAAED